ncbi:MAG: GYF domain-containing protein [Akkermansiaceae bacterium]|jgi:uncharacterized membrane protein YhaH (DUF805 family)|nr:GYF domain-containing protein [Akkermansiaceae bacterium]
MSDPKNEWWLSRSGEKFGPVTFDQVVEAAKAGRLEPRTDLLFGGDLKDWTPAGQVEGVFEKISKPEVAESKTAPAAAAPPMLAEAAPQHSQEAPIDLDLPGATRLGWFLGVTVLPVILSLGLGVLLPKLGGMVGPEGAKWLPLGLLAVPLLILIVTVKRFQNLAMSGWWTLMLFVPLANLWFQSMLFAYPPGYGYTRKLDTIGKVLVTIYWLFLVLSIAAGVAAVLMGGAALLQDERFLEQWQQMQNQIEEMQTAPPQPAPAP